MEIDKKEPSFERIPWINQVDGRKSYITNKTVRVQITWTGDVTVNCGFAPKSVIANGWQDNKAFQTFSDFNYTSGIYWYDNVWVFTVANTENMVETTTCTANPWNRLSTGFVLTVSSFSGSSFYVNFICFA